MEAAMREAFRQMDVSLSTGFREHAQAGAAPFAATAASLQAVLAQATTVADTLKEELAEGQRGLLSAASAVASAAGHAPGRPASPTPEDVHVDPTVELHELLRGHRYEEAFTRALSMADVQLVTWLCCQLDPAILSQEPAVVSQNVLLSLLQQLGCDLDRAPVQVLPWIREAALALNPQEPQLQEHMRPVLEELFKALQRRAAGGAPGPEAATLRLVIHVVNSMRMACR